MTRFLLGVGLMLTLLAAGLFIWYTAERIHTPVSSLLTEAAETPDTDTALSKALQAREKWNSTWHAAAAFSDHAPMDEIDALFAQLPIYAEMSHQADFAACCAQLAALITATAEAHALSWWNIL